MAHLPIRHEVGGEAQVFEDSKGIGRQAISAALIPGKRCLVDNGDLVAQTMQCDCTCCSRRASTNNENFFGHEIEARGALG